MIESQNNRRAVLAQLKKLAGNKSAEELESAWIVAIESDSVTIEELISVLKLVARRGDKGRLESLCWLLLTAVAEREGAADALNVARQAASILPDCESIRQEVASLYRKAHDAFPEVETLTEMTVLSEDIPLATAMQHMEKFLALHSGAYVLDKRRRDAGRVVGLDVGRQVLEVTFADRVRIYNSRLIDSLEPLEDDDFRALAVFVRPDLERLAQEEPAELVRLVLKTHGPRLEFKDLKSHLIGVLPAASWSKWWTTARARVKRSAEIEMSDGVRPVFNLRSRPLAYEERVRKEFESAASAEARFVMVLDHLNEGGDDPAAEIRVLEYFAEQLAAQAGEPDRAEPVAALGALAVLAEIRERVPEVEQVAVPSLEEIVPDV
ncbi:MAG: hypothetical protein QGD94_11060, partial [Planctomycetia bacterium]|nr:hypothetical protein [Planctomycetia bacterium]